jgi:hypothetical protein
MVHDPIFLRVASGKDNLALKRIVDLVSFIRGFMAGVMECLQSIFCGLTRSSGFDRMGDANGTRISWPPGYHGFALVSTYDYPGNGPVIWRPATNQTNGGLVPPGPNRVFQLRKYP